MVSLMLDLLTFAEPSPTPATAVLPVPTPIVNVTVLPSAPDEDWLSVVADGIAGAVIGAIVAALVAVILFRRTMKADREARAEERRVAYAGNILETVASLYWKVNHADSALAVAQAVSPLGGWAGRIRAMYGHLPEHAVFVKWFSAEVEQIGSKTVTLIYNWKAQETSEVEHLKESLCVDLAVLEKSIAKWTTVEPKEWKPVDEIRGQWQMDPTSLVLPEYPLSELKTAKAEREVR